MACGLPVIVSRQAGTHEIIREGENGLTCDALDIACLSRHIERLSDGAYAEQMGLRARKTVEPMTLQAMNQALRALYERLLAEPPPARPRASTRS